MGLSLSLESSPKRRSVENVPLLPQCPCLPFWCPFVVQFIRFNLFNLFFPCKTSAMFCIYLLLLYLSCIFLLLLLKWMLVSER